MLSGIYKIVCYNNNKFYIGSSVNINKRLKEHKSSLNRNKHPNSRLQKDWNKYGESNFRYEIVETIYDISQLLTREKWWINNTECYKKEIGFNRSTNPIAQNTGKFIDLAGQKFGNLAVVEHLYKNKYGQYLCLCKCDCGNDKTVIGTNLKNGTTKSCGCLRFKSKNIKHGHGKRNKTSKTYNSWNSIIQRCTNIHNKNYKNYGGRNPPTTVCDRWNIKKGGSFANFLSDMGEKPSNKHQIGRINNTLGYYKENCHWVLPKANNRNKNNNHILEYNNKKQCVSMWEEEYNFPKDTLLRRIFRDKWSIKRAFTTPVGKYKRG